mmetsp:Transcript_49516/g.159961  ORF Transcript_49516/g.159961 Transcript_49516/m.159961 type:complete len:94 (+) Transcript_49516:1323-1604(+)
MLDEIDRAVVVEGTGLVVVANVVEEACVRVDVVDLVVVATTVVVVDAGCDELVDEVPSDAEEMNSAAASMAALLSGEMPTWRWQTRPEMNPGF